MKIKVKVDINPKKILQSRGLGSSNEVRRYLASQIVNKSDKYTPMQSGTLKNSAQISADGSQIVYPGPYAHYQYYGEVYGPNVETEKGWRSMAPKGGKKPTGRELTYHDEPMRGKRWTERMLADKKHEIEKDVEDFINKKK